VTVVLPAYYATDYFEGAKVAAEKTNW